MATTARIALGTVQFGTDYGVTNIGGRVAPKEIEAILEVAADAGIDLLDTAHLYGQSESVLGTLPGASKFLIVTKTPKFGTCGSEDEAIALLTAGFERSLELLGRESVTGLLFHNADDLIGPWGGRLWEVMTKWKAAGRIKMLGCSVYEGRQIEAALNQFPLDLVQLPYNAIDHRLVGGGHLDLLVASGVEVHARSIFLQGLLLHNPASLPEQFGPIGAATRAIHDWGEAAGLDPLTAVVAATLGERRIDRFVLGVTSASELRAILTAMKTAKHVKLISPPPPPPLDPRYLNPSCWNELA